MLPRTRRSLIGPLLWAVGVLVVAALLVGLDRAWQARQGPDASDPTVRVDPAVRVAGAVRSISGSDGVRRVDYDAAARAATVEVTSRYYGAGRPAADNREHLATEGRLGAQLVLSLLQQDGEPPVRQVVIRLFSGRTLLATVTARAGQEYGQFAVEYAGPLALR
ncbi:MAG: hypothetical protein FJX73_02460 [Armatimonadetes bacterium]|nr:hypothetical protein [Armatimonadota bacterium]